MYRERTEKKLTCVFRKECLNFTIGDLKQKVSMKCSTYYIYNVLQQSLKSGRHAVYVISLVLLIDNSSMIYSTILKPDRNRRRSKQSISLHSALYIDGTNTNKQADKHSRANMISKAATFFVSPSITL